MKNNILIIVMIVLFCLSVWIVTSIAMNYPKVSVDKNESISYIVNYKYTTYLSTKN